MAIELKTEHGTFTGETVREAEELAKKAAREAEKEQGRKDAIRAVAQSRAELAAWRIGYHVLLGNSLLPWTFYPKDGFYKSYQVSTRDTEDEIEIETRDGKGTKTIGIGSYRGCILTAAGDALAVAIADPLRPEIVRIFAVGVNESVCEFELIPNVTAERFKLATA